MESENSRVSSSVLTIKPSSPPRRFKNAVHLFIPRHVAPEKNFHQDKKTLAIVITYAILGKSPNWVDTMTVSDNIAAELKKLRQTRGWSQEGLARELGVSFATVNRWENGKTKPSRLAYDKIKQVANMESRLS